MRRLRNMLVLVGSCATSACGSDDDQDFSDTDALTPSLPLVHVGDVALPGGATRFDYQDIDMVRGHVVLAHMNDGSVVVADLEDGSVVAEIPDIPTARGVVVADDVGLIVVTSSPDHFVVIDNETFEVVRRVTTGQGPDGVGWDPVDKIVAVSDQGDGAMSLLPDEGNGTRTQIPLGEETGNVLFDETRGWFWITVVMTAPPDQLVAVDPKSMQITASIDVPGCTGAHGLRLHPGAKSAFIACEGNDVLARVDLESHEVTTASTGAGPDVMSIDPGLGWLYVAAESGDLTVFDLDQPGLVLIGHDEPGDHSHSVAVDPATHRVFFPLQSGPDGTPVLRVMRPAGT